MMKKLTVILCSTLLISCAPATYEGLKRDNSGVVTFTTNKPALEVFNLVKSQASTCYESVFNSEFGVTAEMKVEGEPDSTGNGVITVTMYGIADDMHLAVEVIPINNTTTRVNAIHAMEVWWKNAELVKRWVVDGNTSCTYKA